jgi:prevent-host-death family protein
LGTQREHFKAEPAPARKIPQVIKAVALKIRLKIHKIHKIDRRAMMRTFSSQDLQQQSGEIQRAAASEPVVIMNHSKPRSIVMSVDEFRRLKEKAGEPVPRELDKPRPIVRRVPMRDPLGYSTSDIRNLALTMADAAMSGRNREAVQAEIDAVERRLGLQ